MSSKPFSTQKEFIEYVSLLAEEGETALFVKQVELKGKDVWPAYLAKTMFRRHIDGAWYGNTASFILSKMAKKASASAANCDYVLCMVLDDVNTPKVPKDPPLAPTWKMETSEGCFQWGYVFRTQPKKHEFEAAMKAIAAAGFTDPGSCNAVRNFRIPGSVNLKKGRNSFRSRLTHFDKNREFTLEEILKALSVVPGPAEGAEYKKAPSKRENDEVFNWLSEKGLVLSEVNSSGWCTVVCPNHENHSVGEDKSAKYIPADRGFTCYHGHCEHIDSAWFLDWVKKEGGPCVQHGAGSEQIQGTLKLALDRLNYSKVNSEAFLKAKEESQAALAAIENVQLGRVTKEDLFKRLAYTTQDDGYFDYNTRRVYSRSTINSIYAHIDCRSIHGGRRIGASQFFDENRNAKNGEIIAGLTYAAGEGIKIARGGEIFGNMWRDGRPDVDKSCQADVSKWLEHGRKLIADDSQFNHVLDVMAYKLQTPGKKINHAVLHAGVEGCGKDTFWAPFFWAVCGDYGTNLGHIDNVTLGTQWGYHLESEVILINELQEPSSAERQRLANTLKPVIAAPPMTLSVNRKGLAPYEALNRSLVIAFSNVRSPLSLSSQDRRWFIIWSEAEKMKEADAGAMWHWYIEKGGMEAISAWLYRRDVSLFNPSAIPMMTDSKMDVIETGRSSSQAHLVQMIKEGSGEFQSGVVGSPFNRMADKLQCTAPSWVKIHHAGITEALSEAGWTNAGRLTSKTNTTPKQVWISPAILRDYQNKKYTKSALRDMAENPPSIHAFKTLKYAAP